MTRNVDFATKEFFGGGKCPPLNGKGPFFDVMKFFYHIKHAVKEGFRFETIK